MVRAILGVYLHANEVQMKTNISKNGDYLHANEVQMKTNMDKSGIYLQVNEVQMKKKFSKNVRNYKIFLYMLLSATGEN